MPKINIGAQFFDVPYGLASASVTTGKNIIATTESFYHGISIVAGATTKATITVYDNASATTGNIVDIFAVESNANVWVDKYIPIIAKSGLTIKASGSDLEGAIFYVPKG